MNTRVPMTPDGARALKDILEDTLKKIDGAADKIAHARGFGDLSENAEYSEAKQEQALLMKLSHKISTKLRNSQIIDPTKLTQNGKVVFGTTVHLRNTDIQEVLVVKIVGEDEADIKIGKISFNSPIARGIIGKRQNDHVQIHTLERIKPFTIEKVEYI